MRTNANAVRIAPSLTYPASRLLTTMPGADPSSSGHSSAQLTEPEIRMPEARNQRQRNRMGNNGTDHAGDRDLGVKKQQNGHPDRACPDPCQG